MHSLIDDLRHSPTPPNVTSRESLARALKSADTALLRAALSLPDNTIVETIETDLRRYALWLEDIVSRGQVEEQERLSSLASTIYEFVAGLYRGDPALNVFQPPLNDLLRGAITASFTSYPARSSLIARRAKSRIQSLKQDSHGARAHAAVAEVTLAFLTRDFRDAFNYGVQLDQLAEGAAAELQARDASLAEIFALDRAIALGYAIRQAAAGMLVGASALLDGAIASLQAVETGSLETEDANQYWLASRLDQVCREMRDRSMHLVLEAAGIPNTFRSALARDGFFEMWGPQLDAIRQGLTSTSKHFVISMPTGSGKTLLAELAILTALAGKQAGWGIYIVPTRALAAQVTANLRHRLVDSGIAVRTVLAGSEQSLLLTDEVELLSRARSVTVTTPEKLDAYYRTSRESGAFADCRLLIVDEAHKIGDANRGALLESLITRFLVGDPQTRIVLLSGVMSNADELAAWLDPTRTECVIARRRATRQVSGVAVRTARVDGEPKAQTRAKLTVVQRRVEFKGGIVLVYEEEDLNPPIAVNLPRVFDGYFTERQFGHTWREQRHPEPRSSANDHAIQLAQVMARSPGTTLVFVENTTAAEKGARECDVAEGEFTTQRSQLAEFIQRELGVEHPLAGYCRRGVAYHHARLPSTVLRALELALESGWLKVVFATGTLREGLNTPVTTVILAGQSYWNDSTKRRQPMEESDFVNIAGRAGRPRIDTEGRVILIPDSLVTATAIEAGRKYVLVADAALRVTSQIRQLQESLELPGGDLRKLPVAQQALVLGLKAAGLDDEGSLASFFSQTLWSLQESDEELVANAADRASTLMMSTESLVGEAAILFASKLGLSLSSAEALDNSLSEYKDVFQVDPTPDTVRAQVRVLLGASLLIPEIQHGALASEVSADEHLEPLLVWMAGGEYASVLAAAAASGALKNSSDITDAVRYCTDLSTWLSWSFGGGCAVLNNAGIESSFLTFLPLRVRYGVSTGAAACLSLLGVSDRRAAEELGKRFEATGRSTSLDEIERWMATAEEALDETFPPHADPVRSSLLHQHLHRIDTSEIPFGLFRFRGDASLKTGSVVTFAASESEVKVLSAQKQVGVVSIPGALRSFLRGSPDSHAAVILDAPAGESDGVLAAVR